MTRTYYCHPFGRPLGGTYIKASTLKKARELAAFRLRLPRHLVCVKPEPADGRGHYFVSI